MEIAAMIEGLGLNEAQIIDRKDSCVTIMVKVPYGSNMLATEENIQNSLNEAGKLATECALSGYDTDGSPITVSKIRYTSKGLSGKHYQTPYGEIYVQRHVYQNSFGGSIYCPLEQGASIIGGTTTPRFARMVSSKYSRMGSAGVQKDLRESNERSVARCYIQDISEAVGGISLYNSDGERLYTRYSAMPPESGKNRFYELFTREIKIIKRLYPRATYVGVADGAADNWNFLQEHVQTKILDYFHAVEYLSSVSQAAFKRPFEGKGWFDKEKHILRDENNGAKELLKEMTPFLNKRITDARKEKIQAAITYFSNHLEQMDYWKFKKGNLPIGSGVIEAACKVIIKQRLCCAGMKWTDAGAKNVLMLRCLNDSDSMWEQFWNKKCKH
jgi:hypothetical protein